MTSAKGQSLARLNDRDPPVKPKPGASHWPRPRTVTLRPITDAPRPQGSRVELKSDRPTALACGLTVPRNDHANITAGSEKARVRPRTFPKGSFYNLEKMKIWSNVHCTGYLLDDISPSRQTEKEADPSQQQSLQLSVCT